MWRGRSERGKGSLDVRERETRVKWRSSSPAPRRAPTFAPGALTMPSLQPHPLHPGYHPSHPVPTPLAAQSLIRVAQGRRRISLSPLIRQGFAVDGKRIERPAVRAKCGPCSGAGVTAMAGLLCRADSRARLFLRLILSTRRAEWPPMTTGGRGEQIPSNYPGVLPAPFPRALFVTFVCRSLSLPPSLRLSHLCFCVTTTTTTLSAFEARCLFVPLLEERYGLRTAMDMDWMNSMPFELLSELPIRMSDISRISGRGGRYVLSIEGGSERESG